MSPLKEERMWKSKELMFVQCLLRLLLYECGWVFYKIQQYMFFLLYFPFLCLLLQGRGNGGNLKIFLTIIFQEWSHMKILRDSRAQTGSWPEAAAAGARNPEEWGKGERSVKLCWQHRKKGGRTREGMATCPSRQSRPQPLPHPTPYRTVPYLSGTCKH